MGYPLYGTSWDGIPSQVVRFDMSFGWFLLAAGLLAFAVALWIFLSSLRERLTLHFVRCPGDGRRAHVFVRRAPSGLVLGVQRCSLLSPPTRITCHQQCLQQVSP